MRINLRSKESRKGLPEKHEPYWLEVDRGFSLGYRKGVWYVRRYINGKYRKKRLGLADDSQLANGINVLSFTQARQRASAYEDILEHAEIELHPALYTVADACKDYLEWFRKQRKSYATTQMTIDAHILSKLGKIPIANLTTLKLKKWHQGLAESPPYSKRGNVRPPYATRKDTGRKSTGYHPIYEYVPIPYAEWTPDMVRKRQSTANRILTVLKAVLNKAWEDERPGASNQAVWSRVKAFKNVDAAKITYLEEDQAREFLQSCSDEFRPLAYAALLTGCRYSELVSAEVRDLHLRDSTLHIRNGKTGQRDVELTPTARDFFAELAHGKDKDAILLSRNDGKPWGRSHHTRPMRQACEAAGIKPVGFHALRHTHAVLLLRPREDADGNHIPGASMAIVAKAIGDSVKTCEKHYAHVLKSDVQKELTRVLPNFA